MRTEAYDSMLHRDCLPCTAALHDGDENEEVPDATSYALCPVCGALVTARCEDCGGQEACNQLLDTHLREYHAPARGCRS